MPTVRDILNSARDEIANAGIESPRLTAELLLAEVLGCARSELAAHGDVAVTDAQVARLEGFLQRRLRREPVDYIVGSREFYGRRFIVRPGVLIPRPETETIVEICKKRLPRDFAGVALDLGTGSGCLAVTLALEFARLRMIALDVSVDALRVAAENAGALKARVALVCSNWLAAIRRAPVADLIVANPPYVDAADKPGMQPEVRDFEPAVALFGGEGGGTATTRALLPEIRARLRNGGLAAVEFGAGQGAELADAARAIGFTDVELARDLTGLERVLVLRP
ncbi:MAG: peptide chain release factor N(5)-glutamine methyltransferase [Planctomycetes bacterium]|nr:peptide chain release factor N(5)-glutamine methyltransferase [Planctomycetota bacterium]